MLSSGEITVDLIATRAALSSRVDEMALRFCRELGEAEAAYATAVGQAAVNPERLTRPAFRSEWSQVPASQHHLSRS